MEKYNVLKVDSLQDCFLVIANTYENPINDLLCDGDVSFIENGDVIFDLAVINGINFNRFIQVTVESHRLQAKTIKVMVAFPPLGLAGLFKGKKWGIFAGTVLGCLGRFIVHFISGITIYRIYAPTEILGTVFDEPNLYSLVYNGSYMLPNTILALAIAGLLYAPLKRL